MFLLSSQDFETKDLSYLFSTIRFCLLYSVYWVLLAPSCYSFLL